ncbi:hypothetical protein Pen02_29700 [Plantactinospora endophytica]|uniref:Uncharacterized protein n=1 Tax=Plantactinospora endophytica TaxID=673535 RepID=A0ABQ4DZY6_9ACTN|nr:hypothetical protein Pen02_29700 [Plantactinospora endophytica]
MQGRSGPEPESWDAAALGGRLVPARSVCALPAEHREVLFPDRMFPSMRGRPLLSASAIVSVLALRRSQGLADGEAVQTVRGDLGWRACGLPIDCAGRHGAVIRPGLLGRDTETVVVHGSEVHPDTARDDGESRVLLERTGHATIVGPAPPCPPTSGGVILDNVTVLTVEPPGSADGRRFRRPGRRPDGMMSRAALRWRHRERLVAARSPRRPRPVPPAHCRPHPAVHRPRPGLDHLGCPDWLFPAPRIPP